MFLLNEYELSLMVDHHSLLERGSNDIAVKYNGSKRWVGGIELF